MDKYSVFEKDLAEQNVDLAFIHPTQIGLQATKGGNYVGLCTAKGYTDYHPSVLVQKDSPLKSLQDLKGKNIGVPRMESITTTMFISRCRA